MKTAAFIYARMDSTRLPGKALKLLSGRPMIDIVIDRVKKVPLDVCVLLTTARAIDDPLVEHVKARGIESVRGSAEDLVARTLQAIEDFQVTQFIRVNGDSPFFDGNLAQAALSRMEGAKLVSNLFQRTFPYGVAVELVDADYYVNNADKASIPEKEHVTKHLYRIMTDNKMSLSMRQARDDSYLSLSVDTLSDHQRLDSLLKNENRYKSYWEIYNLKEPCLLFNK